MLHFLNPNSILIPKHCTNILVRSSAQYDTNAITVAVNYQGVIKPSNISITEATLIYEKTDENFYYYHILAKADSGNNFISIMCY